jgi:hypothetical protein
MLMPTSDALPLVSARATSPCTFHTPAPPAAWPARQGLEELWLLGLPPLGRLLEFADSADSAKIDRAALTSEWRRANDLYMALEKTEAGAANIGTHRALDPALAEPAAAIAAHAHFRRSFNTLPTGFEMVELDALIVDQRHVTRDFVESRMARLGTAPDTHTLFQLCMPLDEPEAPVQIQKVGSRRYVLRSRSADFRFHEAVLLKPEQLSGYDSYGVVAGIVGLVVGFGANFLNAVRVGPRVLLCNGYHRAVALRALGVTHAPCIVQTASRVDELEVTVKSRIADEAEFYFESARPPLLRDFFNPQLVKMLPIRPGTRQIEVNFEVKDYYVNDQADTP